MNKTDAAATGWNQLRCQSRDTGSGQGQSGRLPSRSATQLRSHQEPPCPSPCVTLSSPASAAATDSDCYNAPRLRVPRQVHHTPIQLPAPSPATSENINADRKPDADNDALEQGNAAIQEISGITIHHIANAIFRPVADHPQPVSPIRDDLEQLSASGKDITQVLQRQPTSRSALKSAFQHALQRAFPAMSPAPDPDHIYVTQYSEHKISSSAQPPVFARTPDASQTLTAALLAAVNLTPDSYDPTRTGFFRQPDNADDINEIPQMKGQLNLLMFEKILQDTAMASARDHQYRQALRQFWNSHDRTLDAEQTPRTWLARKYGEQRLTEARLRVSDGTLTAPDLERLTNIVENRLTENPPGAFSMSLQDHAGNIAISGVLVVTQSPQDLPDSTPGRVLLVIPGQGVLAYSSASGYRQSLQQLFDTTSQRDILLMRVAQADRQRAADLDNSIDAASPFRYRAISGPALLDRIQSLLQQQARDITSAALSDPERQSASPVALDRAADLSATFDIAGVLHLRQQLFLDKFLQAASDSDRSAWFNELQAYQLALQKTQTSGFPAMWQFLDPGFLTRYARDDMRARIKHDLQLDIDPDHVTVTTYTLSLPHTTRGDLPAPPHARQPEKIAAHTTLTELALANTRLLDLTWGDEFPVTDSQGKSLPQLTREYLTNTIRTANIGQRYHEFLQSHLLDSPEGLAREKSYAQFLKAQLQLDVREAKISGDISPASAHWVQAALKGSPLSVNHQPVLARHLLLAGKPLSNILIFATEAPQVSAIDMFRSKTGPRKGAARIVMYTPDAPDGKRLRDYDNRAQMISGFINNPAMREYLLQHVDLEQQGEIGTLLDNRMSARHVRQAAITGDFLRSAYRTQVQHILADTNARTTSNSEADRQAWWDKVHTALDIAGIILPFKLSMPLSLIRAGYAFYSSSDAKRRGDDDGALIEFANGISLLVGAASDSLGVPATSGEKLYRAKARKQPAAPTGTAPLPIAPLLPAPAAPVPAGMTAVQIDGLTYYYWNSANRMVRYRDLFIWDPAHSGQLKSAGHGAPDAHQVWKRMTPLKGGSDRPETAHSSRPVVPVTDAARPIPDLGPVPTVPPVIKKTSIAGGQGHFFSARINGRERDLTFNLEKNAFHETGDIGKNAAWYVLRNNQMQALNPAHHVTDTERQASLLALGIDLHLPLHIPAATYARPIPRIIRSVWVGDQVIPPELVSNLGRNAYIATLGGKPYKTKLYLSNQHPHNFQENLAHLREHAPLVDVITLEDSRFYREFRSKEKGKYFAQYQAVLNGNGGIASNGSSAADILRYQLLFHKGGLYMDLDDKLRPLGSINLQTTPAGLALNGPVSNSTLGMDAQYNTSIFGTQKYNPTLSAVSEESYQRFLRNQDLYTDPRPRKSSHSERQISDYMKRISYVTGPDVFNKVVNDRLPEMHQLREAIRLRADSSIEIPESMQRQIDEWQDTRLPLNDLNQIGNAHSWEEYR